MKTFYLQFHDLHALFLLQVYGERVALCRLAQQQLSQNINTDSCDGRC